MLLTLSVPGQVAEARASDYIRISNIYITAIGGGDIRINFDIRTNGTMNKLGVTTINLYKSDGTLVKTYYSGTYTNMMSSSRSYYSSSIIHIGTEGQRYYAVAYFYASDSYGSDTITKTSASVTAT